MRVEVTKWMVAAFGSGIGFVFGGWTEGMALLMLANALDFGTGWYAGAKTTGLKSKTSYDGLKRKVFVWVMVAVGHIIDRILGPATADIISNINLGLPIQLFKEGHVIRDAVTIGYILNELLSIIENCGKAGVWVPEFLKKIITVLKDQKEG